MIKLSEVYIDDERNAFQPAAPGEVPRQRPEAYRRYLPVETIGGWARFGHHLVDVICYYIIIFAVSTVIVVVAGDDSYLESGFSSLVNILLVVMYYFVFESLMQTTPGKLITGSVVVNEYGQAPSTGQVLGRSFARLVPFEAFSCLGDPSRGWHDSWSGTYVMRKQDLKVLLDRIAEMEGENRYVYNSLISEER